MAQRQIIALPVANTPDGTELIVVRQGVFDKKLTVDSLNTYIQSALDSVYLNESANLSDLADVPTARTNLSVYSKAESDAAYLAKANNLSGVASPLTAFDNIKQAATVTYQGVVELATNVETDTGTDSTRAVTPAGLTYKLGLFQTSLQSSLQTTFDARYLLKSSNLSDVPNKATARTNLDVYSKSDTDGFYAKKSNNLSDLTSPSTAFGNIKQVASVSATGVVELATNVETDTGTDGTRAVTPSGLTYKLGLFQTSFQSSLQTTFDARYLRLTNNLSDLPNKATSRSNLDVYSKSESDSSYTKKSNNLSDLTSASTAFGNIKQPASVSATGVVELATNTETQNGTDSTRAVTPSGFKSAFTGSNQVLSSNGYQKLPGGLIIQWGSVISTATTTAIVFPIAFPTAVLSITLGDEAETTGGHSQTAGAYQRDRTKTGFTLSSQNGTETMWMAVGY